MTEQAVPEIGPVPRNDETWCDLGRHDRCDGAGTKMPSWCDCLCHD